MGRSTVAFLCALAIPLAGCGADDEEGRPPGTPVPDGRALAGVEPPPRLEGPLRRDERLDEQPAQPAVLRSENEVENPDEGATAQYIEDVIQHADRVWTEWFLRNGLREPNIGYEIIRSPRVYRSNCLSADGGYDYTADHPNAYYCPRDANSLGGRGVVILPAITFMKMWSGNIFQRPVSSEKRVGDFAAGAIVAHEFGHHVQDEISEQRKIARPPGKNVELIADCFAGVWAYGVFLVGALRDGDVDEAVNALEAIGDDRGSHGTGAERKNAFLIGLSGVEQQPQGGLPELCIENYWRAPA